MEEYLSYYGWHFSKKMCDWAVSNMYKMNGKNKEYIDPITKERFADMQRAYNVKLNNKYEYDALYVANMVKADFWGSSIQDEMSPVKYVKAYTEDPDGYEGMPFTRFYADCIGSGTPIPWEDVI